MKNEADKDVVLSVSNLSKVYGVKNKKSALCDISLVARRGQCISIVGRNGAGKTTLLKIIAGILTPTAGRITRTVSSSYQPEIYGIYPHLSARESLEYFAILNKKDNDIDKLVDMLKLPNDNKRFGTTYSKGMKRKTTFGMMLASDSNLFIMDEPFEGLDPEISYELVGMINHLKNDSKTFVIASHDLSYVEKVSDYVIIIEQGKIRETLRMVKNNKCVILFTSDIILCRSVLNRLNVRFNDNDFPLVRVTFEGQSDELFANLIFNGLRFTEARPETLSETILQMIR